MPDPDQVLELTVPLSPLLRRGAEKPSRIKRLRPQDSLDLRQLRAELSPSTLTTLSLGGYPWSVVSVFSPYTPDVHVMLLEASVDRYLPAPENLEPDEGEALMPLWSAIVGYLGRRPDCERLCVGYNWSPRAWGAAEERGGFQSLPTKWHPMLWSWPPMPGPGEATEYARWVELHGLSRPVRRVMGQNRYAEPLGRLLGDRIQRAPPASEAFLVEGSPQADAMGFSATLRAGSLHGLFRQGGFFSRFLQPLARQVAEVLQALTETLTSLRYRRIDAVLRRTEHGMLSDSEVSFLRSAPQLRPYAEAEAAWLERGLPSALLPDLYPPVERRCLESGPEQDWWRKGFGYALVLTEQRNRGAVDLRLLPGVYVGPGGVVEAQRIVLRRPERRTSEAARLEAKSRRLWELAGALERRFPKAH